ncbi:protein phosphatase 2C domain-containing protein [Catenulispora rubra]|uniref:protein phosphatase 2C domain-containing protein n=1 Tax=Catenulispora rubra TaxID=280293 RepID=UPI0018923C04|nr:protein phosphatase 2C domain-containing protein [Catenulispora rubra]
MPSPAGTAVPDDTAPWPRITVDIAGPEFEPRPPEQFAFDFPDTECDGWSTPDFTVRSASVRGASHRYSRKPRQDAARVAVHEDSGAVVFAVADGVSGATDSQLGALEACRAAMERLLYLLSQDAGGTRGGTLDLDSVAHHAAERLRQLSAWRLGSSDPQSSAVAAGWYATTLVAGILQQEPTGPRVRVCRIGDSGAWLLDRATGSYHALFGTKTGSDTDLVSNAVRPLPHVPDPVEQTTEHLTANEVLLIGTDGFGDPLGDGDGLVGALFARHLAVPPSPLRMAHVLDFSRETFDDDRTLVAVWPRSPGGAP